MMKKISLVILLLGILLLSVGCENAKGQNFSEYLNEVYPYIEYHNSSFNLDADNRKFEIIDGYELNQGNSYEWVETEDGWDLIIHFTEKDGE
jgi:hypothetical protein